MALRDQPYLPLYVQDFLTDEKLRECSAESIGVYIMLMCVMHKSEEYGTIILKPKDKKFGKEILDFSHKLRRQLPFGTDEIERALTELLYEGVLNVDGNMLYQKRMVKDSDISEKRAIAGSKGGKNVRNTNTKKLYNKPGFIYLMRDRTAVDVFKVGISKDPRKRLLALSNKLGKELELIFAEETDDMGLLEDNILTLYNDNREGEWIFGVKSNEIIESITKANSKQNNSKSEAKQQQNLSKTLANSEYEYEYENEYENDNEYDSNEDNNEDNKTARKRESLLTKTQEAQFNQFWEAYPRKVSKANAAKAWAKINPDDELTEKIISAIGTAKRLDERFREMKFTPHPASWLNAQSWEDEFAEGGSSESYEQFVPSTGFKLRAI